MQEKSLLTHFIDLQIILILLFHVLVVNAFGVIFMLDSTFGVKVNAFGVKIMLDSTFGVKRFIIDDLCNSTQRKFW